jgi:hypothetical protein
VRASHARPGGHLKDLLVARVQVGMVDDAAGTLVSVTHVAVRREPDVVVTTLAAVEDEGNHPVAGGHGGGVVRAASADGN